VAVNDHQTPPSMVGARALVGALVLATMVAACTAVGDEPTTTTATPTTTSTTTPSGGPTDDLVPPDVGDPDTLAESWLEAPTGYVAAPDPGLFESDALTAIGLWLPTELVIGRADAVYTDGDRTIVVSAVVPTTSWRADPGLVPALASLDSRATEVSERVFATTTEAGLEVWLWSNGDGFLVATSLDGDAAAAYLTEREAGRSALATWETGDCLYVDPAEGLPWAPITLDLVVPCEGAHNAEVLLADPGAVVGDAYDDDAITYQRNYACDEAYESRLGPQKDRTPSLVTYMPDADEFARGDRYLACVTQIDTNDGWELYAGRLADRTDLLWEPTVGDCFGPSIAPEGIDCDNAHAYQFVGVYVTDVDAWPTSDAVFVDGCTSLLGDLEAGPATLDVLPMGLYPYAFERGDRTVRCLAFAADDGGRLDVMGSFFGQWRTLGSGGVAA
jgi:Septum formation